MADPLQIPTEPVYEENLEIQIQLTARAVRLMIENMPTVRTTFESGVTGFAWYYHNNDIRKIYDTMSLVEHDLMLLIQQLLNLRKNNLDLYES